MSCLEDLIKELCPNGVEFKTLGEMVIHGEKVQINKSIAQETGKYPVINSAREALGYCDTYNNEGKSLVLTSHGAYAGYTHWLESPFLAGALCYPMRSKDENELLSKFIYYWLQNEEDIIRQKFVNRSGVPYVNARALFASPIPVPPLEVQKELVRIFEKLKDLEDNLEAELKAELEARRKQYQFYREKLLNFKNNTPLSRILGEVCEISRGVVMSKKFIEDNKGPYPVYSSQTENNGELGRISTYNIDGEYLTWTTDGANAGSVFYRTGKFSITNVCGLIKVKDKNVLSTRFLYYVLQITAKSYVNKGMGNPKLMSNVMATVKIPVPPLAEQKRIVEILDKFSTLIDDISSGLPAEIKMRHQQYEYYRDKLLTFTQAA